MFLARFKKSLLASAVMLGGLCGVAAAQTADTKVLSNQILPKDTYFYMSMPSVEGFKESFEKSSAGRLFADPALEEFKNELKSAFNSELSDELSGVHDALGLTYDELLAIPTGEVTLAFSKAPPNKMGLILFMDFGTHESEIRGLLEKAEAVLNNSDDLDATVIEHDGSELKIYTVTSDIASHDASGQRIWLVPERRTPCRFQQQCAAETDT